MYFRFSLGDAWKVNVNFDVVDCSVEDDGRVPSHEQCSADAQLSSKDGYLDSYFLG
jgi:hypothetical protein